MKPWYKSKTIWFNTFAAMGTALAASLPGLQALFTPTYFAIAGVGITLVNVWLRTITTEGLTTSKE